MMKKSLIGATILVASGGAVGVSAGSVNHLKGSDTLFDLTQAVFNNCPGVAAGEVYDGTGSGNGQGAMVKGTQTVAPMSRFLNGGAMCTTAKLADGGALAPSTANGMVIGLDGVEIVGSKATLGDGGPLPDGAATVACNGDDNTQCVSPTDVPSFEATTGASYNTTITTSAGTYTFTGWRDVLRVLLAGFDHNAGNSFANRDCASPVRVALANSWGNFFENQCGASAGEAAVLNSKGNPCTALRHVFRRDDFSGTTDTIVGLLNLPSIVNPETSVTVTTVGADGGLTTTSITQHTGATPFCNAVRPSFVFPTTTQQPTCLAGDPGSSTSSGRTGTDATYDPTTLCPNPAAPAGTCTPGGTNTATAAVNAAGCTRERAVLVSTMQDNDPIRMPCGGAGRGLAAGQEDVCSHSGDLGLVLPMNDVPEPNTGNSAFEPTANNTQRYNAVNCGASFTASQVPDIYDAVTQAKVTSRTITGVILCPDGDLPNNTGSCLPPDTAAASAECLALKQTVGRSTKQLNVGVPLIDPKSQTQGDGREWNQHLYAQNGGSAVYQTNAFAARNLPITGAFYRLHALRSMNPVTLRTCQLADMTDQIGCLVEASPCSLGYAGRGATNNVAQNNNTNTAAIKVFAQSPLDLCIQDNFRYPLSRKLYLNSLAGLQTANVNGEELQFTGCETDLAQPNLPTPTPAGLMTNSGSATGGVQHFGFIPLPNGVALPDGGTLTVNNGEPYCEDFNEVALCGAAGPNSNACATAPANNLDPSTFNFNTTCGDGVVQAYEDCDNGAANGPLPATCSTTCRFNQ
ncbi:MAG: hypothetical protein JOZ69_18155 [Myxococcales bacterium]|nr:hypothetical protein [Myxococcales bacterium]